MFFGPVGFEYPRVARFGVMGDDVRGGRGFEGVGDVVEIPRKCGYAVCEEDC